MTHVAIRNVMARYVKHGVLADKPGMGVWDGIAQIGHYGHIIIEGLHIPYNNFWTDYGVKFKGAPGAHNSFRDSNMAVNIAGIEMGDGTGNCGLGDQLFSGLHITDAQYGISIEGPSIWGRYNQNVTIDGCQFDGISVATVKMRRMENFRIKDCNSTNGATYDLMTCRRYSVQETGSSTSEYTIPLTDVPAGSRTVPLFEIDVDQVEQYRSVYAEIYIDTMFGGIGNKPVLWRGFLAYWSGSTWSVVPKEILNMGNEVAVDISVVNGKPRCSLIINGATSYCRYDGTFKLTGRNYSVKKL